jgi:hypothetical protein
MALGFTQPLTEISSRKIFWGKDGRWLGLTTLPLSCADCLEILEPQTPGTLRAYNRSVIGLLYLFIDLLKIITTLLITEEILRVINMKLCNPEVFNCPPPLFCKGFRHEFS